MERQIAGVDPAVAEAVEVRRPYRWLASATVAAGVVISTAALSAGAQPAAFDGVATASAIRTKTIAPGAFLTDEIIDVGGPTAQAKASNTGRSESFASAPYPGDLIVSAPALARGQGAQGVPDYPAYIKADATAPKRQETVGPYILEASVGDADAQGHVHSDSAQVKSDTSTIVRMLDDGAAEGQAVAVANDVEVGPVHVGSVRTTVTVRRDPGAAPKRSSKTEVSGLSINGTAFEIKDGQLRIAGTSGPLLGDSAEAITSAAGVEIIPGGARETPDGATAGGLTIRWKTDSPAVASSITVEAVLAQASVSVFAGSSSNLDATPVPPTPDVGGSTGSLNPAALSETPVVPPVPAETSGAPLALTASRREPLELPMYGIYIVLAVGAAVVVAGGSVVRLRGVRYPNR